MNTFESGGVENSRKKHDGHAEYDDIIKHYEDSEAEEGAKEKVDCEPHIEEYESLIIAFEKVYSLENLRALQTEEEALNSEERESVKGALSSVYKKLEFLKKRTNVTDKRFGDLCKKYKIISNAVGFINNGVIEHDR